jgi:hypothetical protein
MVIKITTPVLLIAFNRPDTTEEAFQRIREVQPSKLYVAVDGPRINKPKEIELCHQVVEITKNVDWPCTVHYLIREKNLGCKLGVSGAISWALENEDRVIIIEDDILAVPAFFSFAENLLEKYKDDERIAMISANQYTPIEIEADYMFTKYGHIWGWATWKRVWDKFDVNIPEIESAVNEGLKEFKFVNIKEHKYFRKYFRLWMEKIKNKVDNAWGPQFVFFRNANNLLSVAPKVNLASNIGTTSSRTDNVAKNNNHYYVSDSSFVLKKHPKIVEVNDKYDKHHFNNHLNKKTSPIKIVINKAKIILKLK